VRSVVVVGIAALGLGAAHVARDAAELTNEADSEPYAPSPAAAPIVSLGFRELAADLLSIRLTGYYGGRESTADSLASLTEAIVALDPRYHRAYDYGANAMTLAAAGVTQSTYLRAIAVLEQGIREFPDDWQLPYLAGEIYTQDLETTDPKQRRAWDERGTQLTEAAIRKPGAPQEAATWVAFMQTKLGQRDRAIQNLHELLLVTRDLDARKRLLDKLAELVNTDSAELAGEIFEERRKLEARWQHDRPDIPAATFILLGPRITPGFDLTDLATGGADLVNSQPIEKLEPLD
jgi:tetratricopeptide (TPR) repeat protein